MAISATPVQTTKGNTGSALAASLVLTFGAGPTAGNTICVVIAVANAATLNLATTNVVWSGYAVNITTGPTTTWMFYGRVAASAGTTITITKIDGNTFTAAAVAAEFTGALRLDKQQQATGSSASPASGNTATTSTAIELEIGALGCRGTWSGATTVFATPTNSFAIIDQDNSTVNTTNNDRAIAMLAKALSSTGAANAGAAITSASWSAQVMTFDESTSGSGGGIRLAGQGGLAA